jgi:hypothetical protein
VQQFIQAHKQMCLSACGRSSRSQVEARRSHTGHGLMREWVELSARIHRPPCDKGCIRSTAISPAIERCDWTELAGVSGQCQIQTFFLFNKANNAWRRMKIINTLFIYIFSNSLFIILRRNLILHTLDFTLQNIYSTVKIGD